MNWPIHDILCVMDDPVNRVLVISRQMQELRERLVQLDAERAEVQQQIAVCMEQLAQLSNGQVLPPRGSSLSSQVLWALRRHPDRAMAPLDIAAMLNIRGRAELTNVRVLLSRMARDGRARRVGHGRYMAIS